MFWILIGVLAALGAVMLAVSGVQSARADRQAVAARLEASRAADSARASAERAAPITTRTPDPAPTPRPAAPSPRADEPSAAPTPTPTPTRTSPAPITHATPVEPSSAPIAPPTAAVPAPTPQTPPTAIAAAPPTATGSSPNGTIDAPSKPAAAPAAAPPAASPSASLPTTPPSAPLPPAPAPHASPTAARTDADTLAGFVVVPSDISTQADGSMLIDKKYRVTGDGTKDRPYQVTWELLVSAEDTFEPKSGKKTLPRRIAMLHDKYITIKGYIAFPMMVSEPRELLMMLNQWDGCCIGVPPTPYDAIEVMLDNAVTVEERAAATGGVTGRFGVKPYIVGDWLVGLYVLDRGQLLKPSMGADGT